MKKGRGDKLANQPSLKKNGSVIRRNTNVEVVDVGAGVGGGTFLAMFAQSFPPGSTWGLILTALSPTFTVAVSGIWAFIRARVSERWEDHRIESVLEDAKAEYEKMKQDGASPEAINNAEKVIEKLRMKKFEMIESRVPVATR